MLDNIAVVQIAVGTGLSPPSILGQLQVDIPASPLFVAAGGSTACHWIQPYKEGIVGLKTLDTGQVVVVVLCLVGDTVGRWSFG